MQIHDRFSDYMLKKLEDGLLSLPNYMRDGVRRYFLQGIPPGGFFLAVLENDLIGALGHADRINQNSLPVYGEFLYNYVPASSWGSPEKVQDWMDSFKD